MFTETSAGGSSGGKEPAPRRRPGRPPGPTQQSAETRRTLYRVAISLFAAEGYESTTLRMIAAKADVSPALLYRYFPSKRAVVLALYDELSEEFRRRAQAMPEGKWRDRYVFALETSLDVLAPHRDTLVALVPILVGGRDEGLFAPATEFSRSRVQSAFVESVTGATDAPKRPDAEALGRALDLVHLGILLLWLLDRSAGQRATSRFVAVVKRTMPAFALAYRLRVLKSLVHDLDAIARESLYGKSAA